MNPKQPVVNEWSEVGELLGDLYSIVKRLEEMFPGRKFTPDGHLVGSIGEALAAHMFDLRLLPASAPEHDATTADGKTKVQIKLTQGKSIAIRSEPDHLIVLRLSGDLAIEVVYNGRGACIWSEVGRLQKNGSHSISVTKLRAINSAVSPAEQLPLRKEVDLRR